MYTYKKVKLPDGSTIDEHRLIMENHIGRKLGRDEVVHHIDENKFNNSICNLQLLTRREHSKLHMQNKRPRISIEKLRESGRRNRGRYKLQESDVIKIRAMIGASVRVIDVAKAFNVCRELIYQIKNRRIWA